MHLLNIDFGGGNEAHISAATWHKRLDHVNAADQEELRRKGVAVEYKDKVLHYSTCDANKSTRQPCNKETKYLATKRLGRVFTDIKNIRPGPFVG